MKKKTLLSWSSGKDSAWALHILRQQTDIEVVGLFSTFNQEFNRIAMHAVKNELVQRQAESLDLPVQLIPIPYPCSNNEYRKTMAEFIEQAKQQGVESIAFGDLYLEDIRSYREEQLAASGVTPLFPLWGRDTKALSKEMISAGLRAKITCIDPKKVPLALAGKEFDSSFLEQLPADVDPCGENGEFHTFVFDGPMFKQAVTIVEGETLSRDGFVFTDLSPD